MNAPSSLPRGWRYASLAVRIVVAVILLQTLFFKFTGSAESVFIFETVGQEPWGRYGSGVVELIASVLLFVPAMIPAGALLALGVMSGAIFFHLTKLGIVVQDDGGLLFALAITVWLGSAFVLVLHRAALPVIGPRLVAKKLVLPLLLAAAGVAFAPAPSARADEPAKINKTFLSGLALDGYDAVAYFTDGKPVKGRAEFTVEWRGAKWRFASAEHAAAFEKEPEKYAPCYGGFCAWAVAHGYTADTDPEAWRIVEGRLYLNYNKDVQAKWEADIPGFIQQADANWPKLSEPNK